VFPQVVLFATANSGNVIACAVNYREPVITDPANWPAVAQLQQPVMAGRLDLAAIRREQTDWPDAYVARARLLTDDFAPVEFLNTVKANNTLK